MSYEQPLMFFNASTGEMIESHQGISEKGGNLFLILNRGGLLFNEIAIKSKKRVKTNEIFELQKHFVPFKPPFVNLIYKLGHRGIQKYLFWIGKIKIVENISFYDEIPETLLFKGDPKNIQKYNLFVFRRLSGFEVIYLDDKSFYSFFERKESKVDERISLLARKFAKKKRISILSDINLPYIENFDIDLVENEQRYFILSDYLPLIKIFSNISQDKKLRNIKKILKSVNSYLTILIFIVSILLGGQIFFHYTLKKDNKNFSLNWNKINNIIESSERIEIELNKLKRKIFSYPEYLVYLKAIGETLDPESQLTSFSLQDNRINLEGFSKNSLAILGKLGKNPLFSKVTFKSPVKKNIYSQMERFFIEILLKKDA